jgi:7 transmembrane receptor (rhodopsin family)
MGSMWWIAGAIFCGTCTVVGSIGNGLTIAIFIAYPKFQNMVGTFIFRFVETLINFKKKLIYYEYSLAACDLLFSMFVSSINVYFFTNSGKWYFHENMCTCYMIICYSLVATSCLNVCLIAMNR